MYQCLLTTYVHTYELFLKYTCLSDYTYEILLRTKNMSANSTADENKSYQQNNHLFKKKTYKHFLSKITYKISYKITYEN